MKRSLVGVFLVVVAAVPGAQAASLGRWTIQPTPSLNPNQVSVFRGVACASGTSCEAVGNTFAAATQDQLTLAERYTRGRWHVEHTADPKGASLFDSLESVACPSRTACSAVGYVEVGAGADQALVEQRAADGWAIQQTPRPVGELSSQLNAVSCPAPTTCVAAGDYSGRRTTLGLTLTWDGTNWRVAPAARPAGAHAYYFNGVSCPDQVTCIAVGAERDNAGALLPVTEAWDGHRWRTLPTPDLGMTDANLNAVSCASATFCVAVGENGSEILAERYNGHTWRLMRPPSIGVHTFGYLSGVSCAGSDGCTAVGLKFIDASNVATLALHWNGTAWARLTPPTPRQDILHAVHCTTVVRCVAVGGMGDNPPIPTLAELWRG